MAAGMSAPEIVGWLPHAIAYVADWLGFQMRVSELPGSVLAVAHRGKLAYERAYGVADIGTGEALTPRHRFRVASQSKTFTTVGVMKLRDQRRLRLDDPVGMHVPDLHEGIAGVTVAQLLAHSGGVTRDGVDAGHWLERQPFLDAAGLDAELARPLVLAPNERFKYSNIGFGLLGKLIASVAGEPYNNWIAREIVAAAGLAETAPDMPIEGGPLARGHGLKLPLGRRPVFDGETPTHALAAATGFVSTAADLARFFGQLSPGASQSVLSPESRREMSRRQWRTPHAVQERYYGLGTTSGELERRAWFGHGGVFPGYVTRTAVAPEWDVAISIVTNANDGLANQWIDGALHIMNAFALNGAPEPAVAGWTGRWWSHWGPLDLVPMGDKVVTAVPAMLTPLADASEIGVTDRLLGRIGLANGYGNHGETVRRIADASGDITSVWFGGIELAREADLAAELTKRHPAVG
jgi:CubicO group peptidase (beta-lactamase class C family)